MAGFVRKVHPQAQIKWGPVKELVPDLEVTAQSMNGAGAAEVWALAFIDPDGETHVYLLDGGGKSALIAQVTGGVVLP